jgi:chemotaxis protein CheX
VTATPGKPYLKGKVPTTGIDIAGIIGLTSARFQGSIALCFPEPTFLAVLSNMLGETYSQITPDLEDGAGELMNIIFGQAKVELNELGHTIEKAIPTVVRGQSLAIRHHSHCPTIVLPFTLENKSTFQIEISVENT